jgi:hypothetical protein
VKNGTKSVLSYDRRNLGLLNRIQFEGQELIDVNVDAVVNLFEGVSSYEVLHRLFDNKTVSIGESAAGLRRNAEPKLWNFLIANDFTKMKRHLLEEYNYVKIDNFDSLALLAAAYGIAGQNIGDSKKEEIKSSVSNFLSGINTEALNASQTKRLNIIKRIFFGYGAEDSYSETGEDGLEDALLNIIAKTANSDYKGAEEILKKLKGKSVNFADEHKALIAAERLMSYLPEVVTPLNYNTIDTESMLRLSQALLSSA